MAHLFSHHSEAGASLQFLFFPGANRGERNLLLPAKTFIFFYLPFLARVKTSLSSLQNIFAPTPSQALYAQESNLYPLFCSEKGHTGSHKRCFVGKKKLNPNRCLKKYTLSLNKIIPKSLRREETICRRMEIQVEGWLNFRLLSCNFYVETVPKLPTLEDLGSFTNGTVQFL